MKLQYLGTGAAERVPALFCHCKVCRYAREHGGKDVRTQTQALIDDGRLMIDFPGDSYLHALNDGLDFGQIHQLLITHWHSDHLYAEDLALRMHGYGQSLGSVLHVYGNRTCKSFTTARLTWKGVTIRSGCSTTRRRISRRLWSPGTKFGSWRLSMVIIRATARFTRFATRRVRRCYGPTIAPTLARRCSNT